jgi:hypothetical protein
VGPRRRAALLPPPPPPQPPLHRHLPMRPRSRARQEAARPQAPPPPAEQLCSSAACPLPSAPEEDAVTAARRSRCRAGFSRSGDPLSWFVQA